MITYKKGDLLAVKEGVIIHGCNAQGVMGSGVAKQIRAKYPEAYYAYLNGTYELGTITMHMVHPKLVIVNAITQRYYGTSPEIKYVSYDAITKCFREVVDRFPSDTKLHIPKIGSGLGNGDWSIISRTIDSITVEYDVTCWEL